MAWNSGSAPRQVSAIQTSNSLRVSKGPSLGTNYSLACPYTLLAHYGELGWAEDCGVPRDLVRISTGLEEVDDLVGRFEEALEKA